ncbi:MAG TPA: hypothetical protein VN883_11675, partial [Myxococcales bacterium]|nr:hypothetical protein [Myxococcales bacterium]
MSIVPPAGKAQGKAQGACAEAVPLPEMVNDGKAASWASAEGGPAALRCNTAGSTWPSVAVAGSDPVKEAVIRGGSWMTTPRLLEAVTGPAPFPSCAEALTVTLALPAGVPASTGMEKCSDAPAASRATEPGDGEPALMGPETCVEGERETASTSPLLFTRTSRTANWPLTSRAGPETADTDNSVPAWTSNPTVAEALTGAPETASFPDTERAKLAGATELPSPTGERVTEPPAGTDVGGSCSVVTGAPDPSSTRPEPPAAIDSTAAGTSTSPALEIRTVMGTLWPLEARGCEGVAAIASAAGLRAAPEEAEAGCATKVCPESA